MILGKKIRRNERKSFWEKNRKKQIKKQTDFRRKDFGRKKKNSAGIQNLPEAQ